MNYKQLSWFTIAAICSTIFFSCNPNSDAEPPEEMQTNEGVTKDIGYDFIWDAKPIKKEKLSSVFTHLCDSLSYEITDLYSDTDKISNEDSLILVDTLGSKGFKVVSSGRVNWEKGDRIITLILETNDCGCRVDKLYYNDSSNGRRYHVTERIACLKK